MKRCLNKILLLAACLCLALSAAAPAQAEPTANYTNMGIYDYALVSGTDSLNLRSGPGTEYQWLGSLAAGNWVGVMGESGNWYHVYVLKTGQFGYMSKNFLKRGNGGSGGSTTGVVSNPIPTQFLNLRSYPSYSAPVLGVFYNGATFTLLSATGDGWYQVQISGMTGYFRKEYVRLNGGGQTAYVRSGNGGKVNLRSAPTYNGSTILGQYAPGTQVSVVLSSPLAGSFWKININGAAGYMDSTYLSTSSPVYPVDPVYPIPGPAPVTHGTAVVKNPKASQKLNLRAQPSTSAKIIAQYGNGVKFQVIQAGETWTKVYGSASGNIGYFMTKYLTLSGVSYMKTVKNGNSYVNLRSSPKKTAGNVYTKVPSGATVTVLIPGDEWTKVRYNGTVGYMMTGFLK